MLLLFSLFLFFFSYIRNMLVRDAQTRSLFVFLFVTILILNVCVCVRVWRAWLSKLNQKKRKIRVKTNLIYPSVFFSAHTFQYYFYVHCWSTLSDFFTHQHFFGCIWVEHCNSRWFHANKTFLMRKPILIRMKINFFI